VIQHHVENDADVAAARFGKQMIEVGQRAVLRIDILVVGNVLAEINLRRRKHGPDPDGVHAERPQIDQVRSVRQLPYVHVLSYSRFRRVRRA